jgi:hypothetical protein
MTPASLDHHRSLKRSNCRVKPEFGRIELSQERFGSRRADVSDFQQGLILQPVTTAKSDLPLASGTPQEGAPTFLALYPPGNRIVALNDNWVHRKQIIGQIKQCHHAMNDGMPIIRGKACQGIDAGCNGQQQELTADLGSHGYPRDQLNR